MATDTDNSKTDLERRFETLSREITVAAREQGPDPDDNLRLQLALRRAREVNMPDGDIDRARKLGAGEIEGPDYREVTYEGYGPEGVAVFVEAITADKSRTAEELDQLFQAHGGNLGEDGCVAWQFEPRGLVQVDARAVEDKDEFMLGVIEMGADELRDPLYDISEEGRVSAYRVYCDPKNVRDLAAALEESGYPVHAASTTREATQTVSLDRDTARDFLEFFEKLNRREDVQNAYANWSSA
ncbi:MAG: YebC/PmpR family DNA-binding transcriptional regulator [Bradymonadaceae bacterium]